MRMRRMKVVNNMFRQFRLSFPLPAPGGRCASSVRCKAREKEKIPQIDIGEVDISRGKGDNSDGCWDHIRTRRCRPWERAHHASWV